MKMVFNTIKMCEKEIPDLITPDVRYARLNCDTLYFNPHFIFSICADGHAGRSSR